MKNKMLNNLHDLGEKHNHQVYLLAWDTYQMKMLLLGSLQDVCPARPLFFLVYIFFGETFFFLLFYSSITMVGSRPDLMVDHR